MHALTDAVLERDEHQHRGEACSRYLTVPTAAQKRLKFGEHLTPSLTALS